MTIKEQIMKLQTYKMYDGEDTVYVERDDVLKALEQQPKTGYWIEHEIRHTCRWLTCSICGYEWINKKENFCPNCGAEMSGGENEDSN